MCIRDRLYIADRRDQRTHAFFTNDRYGELWVGARRGATEAARYYEIETAPLEVLEHDLAALSTTEIVSVRGFDRKLDDYLEANKDDQVLATALSEQRLVKDDFEIAQLQLAVDYTVKGFEDVVLSLIHI